MWVLPRVDFILLNHFEAHIISVRRYIGGVMLLSIHLRDSLEYTL